MALARIRLTPLSFTGGNVVVPTFLFLDLMPHPRSPGLGCRVIPRKPLEGFPDQSCHRPTRLSGNSDPFPLEVA